MWLKVSGFVMFLSVSFGVLVLLKMMRLVFI